MSDPKTQDYFAGVVRRDTLTPDSLIDICRCWFDGQQSAMYRFEAGEPVKPHELVAEASQALSENTQGEKEDARLKELRTWALRQQAICETAAGLLEAQDAFSRAAVAADLAAYQSQDIRESACWGGK